MRLKKCQCERLDSAETLNPASCFPFFFFFLFFCFHAFKGAKFTVHETNFTVYILLYHCLCTVYYCSSTVHTLKNIKNGSHGTIHTFKNYFAPVFSVFSFNNNKFNPNGSNAEIKSKQLSLFNIHDKEHQILNVVKFSKVQPDCIHRMYKDSKNALA